MLYLTRKVGETVVINDDVRVTVVEVRGKSIKLGFTFPPSVSVLREELYDRIQEENRAAAQASIDMAASFGALTATPPAHRSQTGSTATGVKKVSASGHPNLDAMMASGMFGNQDEDNEQNQEDESFIPPPGSQRTSSHPTVGKPPAPQGDGAHAAISQRQALPTDPDDSDKGPDQEADSPAEDGSEAATPRRRTLTLG